MTFGGRAPSYQWAPTLWRSAVNRHDSVRGAAVEHCLKLDCPIENFSRGREAQIPFSRCEQLRHVACSGSKKRGSSLRRQLSCLAFVRGRIRAARHPRYTRRGFDTVRSAQTSLDLDGTGNTDVRPQLRRSVAEGAVWWGQN